MDDVLLGGVVLSGAFNPLRGQATERTLRTLMRITMFNKCHLGMTAVVWTLCLFVMSSCVLRIDEAFNQPEITPTPTISTTLEDEQLTPTPTKEPEPATATPDVNASKIPVLRPAIPQLDETIPSCENHQDPSPLSSLEGVEGLLYYGNTVLDRWFVLSGTPLESRPVRIPNVDVDFFSVSENEEWLLAYSRVPKALDGGSQYPFYLLSKGGEVFKRKLDLTQMTAIAGQNLKLAQFRYWKIEWVTDEIIKVRGAYGESPNPIIPILIYQYFDIERDTWVNEPIEAIPDRRPNAWVDLSPDLTRVLYLTEKSDFALWDNENNQQLWSDFLGSSQLPPYAQWSPDNRKVAFWTDGYPFQVQLLDRDGNGYQRIQNPGYDDVENEFQPYRGFFAWSPNGRYLAISGFIYNGQTGFRAAMLYVYDMEQEKFTYRCPMGDSNPRTVSSNVLWSPDGRFIVPENSQSDTVPFRIYDIENKQVYQVEPEGFAAIAWVKSFSLIR